MLGIMLTLEKGAGSEMAAAPSAAAPFPPQRPHVRGRGGARPRRAPIGCRARHVTWRQQHMWPH